MRIASAVLVAASLALSACGGSKAAPDPAIAYSKIAPATIMADGLKGIAEVKSARVQANIKQNGEPMIMDVQISDSTHCVGSMVLKGAAVQFVIDGTSAYMNGSAAFWTNQAGASAATLFAGKWLTGFPASVGAQIGEGCQLLDKFRDSKDAPRAVSVLGIGTVAGTSVVRVNAVDKAGKPGEVDVSATEPHTVVGMVADGNTLTLSAINQPVSVTAPAGALDIGKLHQ